MRKDKSALHHWWPECVSKHWANAEGNVHRILPNGEVKKLPPSKLGAITNGHMIKLGAAIGQKTPWDENFESQFDRADSSFPRLIGWLQNLERTENATGLKTKDRFLIQPASDQQLKTLTECVTSLVVRSPRNRASAVWLAEHLRGPVSEPERSRLVGWNIRDMQRCAADSVGANAKFVIIYSPQREFIFGDGFFNNVHGPIQALFNPRILAPITPYAAALVVRPTAYYVEPKLTTFVATPSEVDLLNLAVQVYARKYIFFRSEKPEIQEYFRVGKHAAFSGPNPVDELISCIPGVQHGRSPDAIFFSRAR